MLDRTRRSTFTVFMCAAGFLSAAAAHAQVRFTVIDTPSITVGSNVVAGQPGVQGYDQGVVGSISSPLTFDGLTITEFADTFRGGKVGGYYHTVLSISGFPSDPGKTWLVGAQVNGCSFSGSAATTYTFTSGAATWTYGCGPVFEKASPALVTLSHIGEGVDLRTKFQILGVDYAPPGQHSNVNYGSSAMQGTSKTTASTFSTGTDYTSTLASGLNIYVLGGTFTGTYSTSYEQETDTNSSVTISSTTMRSDVVSGPASSAAGVDHDYDVVWVWINPIISYVVAPNAVRLTAYSYDGEDDAAEMEVIPLYVFWLKNPSSIPAAIAARLARSWDPTGLGALTSADYATILAADPFSSTTYSPNTDATHRFDLIAGQTFNYEPPPPGGQPITENFSIATMTTSSVGQGAMNKYSSTWSIEYKSSAHAVAEVTASFKYSNTFTTTDKWSFDVNSSAGKTASFSITGPASADNYTGPVVMQVWRDNVYGSYMFMPVQ